jgi:hypothetical protein
MRHHAICPSRIARRSAPLHHGGTDPFAPNNTAILALCAARTRAKSASANRCIVAAPFQKQSLAGREYLKGISLNVAEGAKMSKKPTIDHDYDAGKDKLTITIHRYSQKRKKTGML